jgi:segregation and condensation protein B
MTDSISGLSDKTIVETILLSATGTIGADEISSRLGHGVDLRRVVDELNREYDGRGMMVVEAMPGRFAVRTRPDASDLCRQFLQRPARMSNAGYETLAVIAYFQPVTRSEIERVRGVSLSAGTLEILIYGGLVRAGPRRADRGNAMTFVTTEDFLLRFNLSAIEALPLYAEMKEQGLLNASKGITAIAREIMESNQDGN